MLELVDISKGAGLAHSCTSGVWGGGARLCMVSCRQLGLCTSNLSALLARSVGLIKDFICPYKASPLAASAPAQLWLSQSRLAGYCTLGNTSAKLGAINPPRFPSCEAGDNEQDV